MIQFVLRQFKQYKKLQITLKIQNYNEKKLDYCPETKKLTRKSANYNNYNYMQKQIAFTQKDFVINSIT